MFRFTMIALAISLVITGCKKGNKEECIPESRKYRLTVNAKIDTLRHGPAPSSPLVTTISSGNKNVFTYQYSSGVCSGMIDGGGFQSVNFEVDPGQNNFKYTQVDFETAKCYYNLGSVLFEIGATIPEGGTIEGAKIDALHWRINIDLVLRNNVPLKVSEIFKSSNF